MKHLKQIALELHTPADPWCRNPISTVYVGYVPRVGDLLWADDVSYKTLQVSQLAETSPRMAGAREKYIGRICVMVEVNGFS